MSPYHITTFVTDTSKYNYLAVVGAGADLQAMAVAAVGHLQAATSHKNK
jgi:hypothetical protein